MKAKQKIKNGRGRGARRPFCCAKLIENIVKYPDQKGVIHRVRLDKSTLAEARRVMNRLEPNFQWVIA